MSQAMMGTGTQLQRGDGGDPETFEVIAEVQNISGPSLSADDEDVTSHDSVDGYREFIQGLKDGGEVTIEGNFLPGNDSHRKLVDDFHSGQIRDWKIVFPDANQTTFSFQAYVNAFEPTAPHDAKLDFSVTLKVTGKPVLADGS